MEKRAQWWAMDSKHWKRGAAASSGGLGVARTALTTEVRVITLRLFSRPEFIPSQPQSAEMALREAPLSELLWGPRWYPNTCTSVSHDLFPCSKGKLPGRSVCDLGKLNWVRWGSGDLRGLPELTHLCWPEAIHSWCLFSCLLSCSQLPCPAHSILFMLPTQLASLGSQQGLWDHPQKPQLSSWVSLGISVSERFFFVCRKVCLWVLII